MPTNARTHTHIHTCTHTRTHAHIHAHTQVCRFLGAGGYGEVYLCKWASVDVEVKCLNPGLIMGAGAAMAAGEEGLNSSSSDAVRGCVCVFAYVRVCECVCACLCGGGGGLCLCRCV